MAQDQDLNYAYHFAIKNWKNSDYLEEVENIPEAEQNFLTSFMVLKDGKPLEKGRLAVNGSRKFKGEALNDFLEPGANAISDIWDRCCAYEGLSSRYVATSRVCF